MRICRAHYEDLDRARHLCSSHSRYRRRLTTYDILIRGGRVLDGSGNPWFPNDVAIQNGRIAAVGQLDGASASRIIDADGLYVTPGFIDMHSHANSGFDDEERRAKATVNNGEVVTTRHIEEMLAAQGLRGLEERGSLPGDVVYIYTGLERSLPRSRHRPRLLLDGAGSLVRGMRCTLASAAIVAVGISTRLAARPVTEAQLAGKAAATARNAPW